MLNRLHGYADTAAHARESPTGDAGGEIQIDAIVAVARRQWPVAAICIFLGVAIGVAYTLSATPLYTSTTGLQIDSQKDKNDVAASIAELTFDTGAIDSQVEILRSEKIALSVISKLNLAGDPEFVRQRTGLVGTLSASLRSASQWMFARPETASEPVPMERVALGEAAGWKFRDVRRVGRTFVLAVDYTFGQILVRPGHRERFRRSLSGRSTRRQI